MRKLLLILMLMEVFVAYAQYEGGLKPLKGIEYKAEAQASVSDGKISILIPALDKPEKTF